MNSCAFQIFLADFTAVMFKEDSPFQRNCIHNLQNTLLSRLLLKLEKLSEQGSKIQFPAVSEAGKSDQIFGGGGKVKKNLLTANILHTG